MTARKSKLPARALRYRGEWAREEGFAYPASSLVGALAERNRVAYTTNGNRVGTPASYLRELVPAMRRCGITRVADISHIPTEAFPVFQTCRPGILGHHSAGQNTGGQGKGPTKAQAQVSAIMEAIEGYCAEPRQVALIRGSYGDLQQRHAILDPNRYVRYDEDGPIGAGEPLMWTEAYSVELRNSVLVPAETVFVPFSPTDFDTRPHFPRSTNGLASGSTPLEAVTHGLYEVIERYFLDLHERGEAQAVLVDRARLEGVSGRIRQFLEEFDDVFLTGVFFLVAPGRGTQVATAICRIRHLESGRVVQGSGASSVANVAIERSVSEAIQAFAVVASGGREDLDLPRERGSSSETTAVAGRKKHASSSAASVADRAAPFRDSTFTDLRDELRFLTRVIHRLGYSNIFIAQLSRVGIDVPVTKVIVPGLTIPKALRAPIRPSMRQPNRLTHLRYGVELG